MGLDTVELIMAVEEHFGIEIADRDAEQLTTVGSIHAKVLEKLREKGVQVFEDDIYRRLHHLICCQLGVKPEQVTPEASIVDDLGAD